MTALENMLMDVRRGALVFSWQVVWVVGKTALQISRDETTTIDQKVAASVVGY